MEITEKVAYLKGLAEGMELDTEKKVGKLLSAIIDVLDDIALELEDVKDEQSELADGLDAVSDDLEDVENVVFDEWDDGDEDDGGEYYYDDLDEDEECYATTCPTCEETIYFDESILEDGEVLCPNCGEKLEFDLEHLDADEEDGEQFPKDGPSRPAQYAPGGFYHFRLIRAAAAGCTARRRWRWRRWRSPERYNECHRASQTVQSWASPGRAWS